VSEQNVALVRAILEGGGDQESILASLDELVPAIYTEDVEFIEMPDRVDSRTHHGHEGVNEAFQRFYEQWESHSAELIDVEDHGDQVFVSVREQAVGKRSGVALSKVLYVVCDFRGDKVCRYFESYDEAAARAALAEQRKPDSG
jgi:ketosteroid isomerase-like protein